MILIAVLRLFVRFIRLYKNGDPTKFSQIAFKAFDYDHNGHISFPEFILSTAFVINKDAPHEDQRRRLDMSFEIFDINSDGKINAVELQRLLNAIGEMDGLPKNAMKNKAKVIIKKYDSDHNKMLSKAEFIDALLHEKIFAGFS